MAIKKSELYSSLWSSCDELRGGMDASQYKDYVLVLLFIKYVSDKYAGQPFSPITIPKGATFKDMVALKGKPDIGDQINKKIIAPLANANKLSDMPDFNDANKLGGGKEMVERLTNLIAIFENKALDFSKNRAEGDDILGDAYEYLMRHFATESGKSKGQFYTPAEVSRIMAQILGIHGAPTTSSTTVYDPTCGSGSLLLKVGDAAITKVTLYGQEKDAATSGLARMNMILHNNPTALIMQGNTIADPKFKDGDTLKTFDYVVANPPFSDKRWSTGLDPLNDPYQRFQPFGSAIRSYANAVKMVVASAVNEEGDALYPRTWNHDFIDLPEDRNPKQPILASSVVTAIVGAPKEKYYRVFYALCASAGLRFGEALGIDISNISPDCATIKICQKAWRGQIHDYLKSESGKREVDLHPTVAEMLKDFIGERKSGLLFCNKRGRQLAQSNILRRSLHPILTSLEQPKTGCHAFRRFRITWLRRNLVPDELIRFWHGHAGRTMTDSYSKLKYDVEFRKQVVEKVGLGFELPSANTGVGPNGPKLEVGPVAELAVNC